MAQNYGRGNELLDHLSVCSLWLPNSHDLEDSARFASSRFRLFQYRNSNPPPSQREISRVQSHHKLPMTRSSNKRGARGGEQLYRRAILSLFVAFYDPRRYGTDNVTLLHAGLYHCLPSRSALLSKIRSQTVCACNKGSYWSGLPAVLYLLFLFTVEKIVG
jgi:hypothetical protein